MILAVRVEEVWAYGPAITDPARVRELHDMRIAFKRLRYLLEIFRVAFPADLKPYIEQVRALQDLLGEIHDRDVQVPMLHEHLDRLAERDVAASALLVEAGAASAGATHAENASTAFRASPDEVAPSSLRPGIEALLARCTRERDELYARFLAEWARLEAAGFRARLERALAQDDDERPRRLAMDPGNAKREAQESVGGDANFVAAMLADRVGHRAGVGAIFGEPVERDGVTVIPVGRVRWGFGGGGGEGGPAGEKSEGSGGGGGVMASPAGYIQISGGTAEYRRIGLPLSPGMVLAGAVAICLTLCGFRVLMR